MVMGAHYFDTTILDWAAHERFPDIRVKLLETRATHQHASVMLVRLAVGGEIVSHIHKIETETAYILSGLGVLTVETEGFVFAPGRGATIKPGCIHSLKNTGNTDLELIAIHTPPTR